MEDMIIQERSPRDHKKDRQIQYAFGRRLSDGEIEDLSKMIQIREHTRRAAACKQLDHNVVIHIREYPVFYIYIYAERFIKADAEERCFQKIQQPVHPNAKPVRVAEPPLENHCKYFFYLFRKNNTEQQHADDHSDVEYAEKFPRGLRTQESSTAPANSMTPPTRSELRLSVKAIAPVCIKARI